MRQSRVGDVAEEVTGGEEVWGRRLGPPRLVHELGVCLSLSFNRATRHYETSFANVSASTRTPVSICSGDGYSSGRWLTPPRHGMNIIVVGQTCAINRKSW